MNFFKAFLKYFLYLRKKFFIQLIYIFFKKNFGLCIQRFANAMTY